MLIHQGTTFARAGSLLQARPILLDEIALRFPELRIVIAHMGHPWFSETIAGRSAATPTSTPTCRRSSAGAGCSTRRSSRRSSTAWTHKLLFGTDFPFFTARETIDGLRSVTGRGVRARDAA